LAADDNLFGLIVLLVIPLSVTLATRGIAGAGVTSAPSSRSGRRCGKRWGIKAMYCWCLAFSPAGFSWRSSPLTCPLICAMWVCRLGWEAGQSRSSVLPTQPAR
jgi:hypothetical protein